MVLLFGAAGAEEGANPTGEAAGGNAGLSAYSEFIRDIKAGKVARVVIDGNRIQVFPKNGEEYETYSPGDSGLIGDLLGAGVVIVANPPQRRSITLCANALDIEKTDYYDSRNAALQVLRLQPELGLSIEQKKALRKLSNDWRVQQTASMAKLKAYYSDIFVSIYSDEPGESRESLLQKARLVERQLIRESVVQNEQIAKLLTSQQRQIIVDNEYCE